MTGLLQVQDLSVSIQGKRVLDKVSLEIQSGEILALTGESGSGKSMTALAIMGLLPNAAHVEGEVQLQGQELLAQTEQQKCAIRGAEIGMVFQEPMTALNPVQSIGQQVAETIRVHTDATRKQAWARAADVLTKVGLPQDRFPMGRFPHELSGGQRQRVVIAMAIALRPKLLIADEPTTALDVTTQAQILELLKDLCKSEGLALLMITHDLAVVSQMADRIAVMKSGQIVEQAVTQDLFAQMSHPYTRALFAASAHQADLADIDLGDPLLRVQNVSRDYLLPRPHPFAAHPRFRAVRDVSFDLSAGERVGLVGESGCGKSTLTRAILGLDPVSAGDIRLDGAPVYSNGKPNRYVQRQIQVVFQDPFGSFNPRHKVERLITEPFHLLDDPPTGTARQNAIEEALEAVGLSAGDAQKYPHAFSGGQRQRLAIARALIIRPKLIVFDEAVSALDVRVRAQILDLIAELSRDYGLAYLFISHDLSVVRSITDRVMVMKSGQIVEHGETARVFDAPEHRYTQNLIAAAPRLPELGERHVS
ncbi:ABC transporter ATP-binding protein [Tropicibacter sp. R15_0]|uniref:ABC transporter ATP-binding protein n=1 Tax=Tropicibacter sp. R15_0 TaxID=2821101 RepID=UPI001ADBF8A3|nr:ABC transporter ATP-binding protein [Tropicibacter sp. R15_0]MBO9463936.1 ABC transporter ATP-binding protein [Tropicibacter sp. R15_0]